MYTIMVRRSRDGWYAIDILELPGVHAQCRHLKQIRQEAAYALRSFLRAARAVGEDLPGESSDIKIIFSQLPCSPSQPGKDRV